VLNALVTLLELSRAMAETRSQHPYARAHEEQSHIKVIKCNQSIICLYAQQSRCGWVTISSMHVVPAQSLLPQGNKITDLCTLCADCHAHVMHHATRLRYGSVFLSSECFHTSQKFHIRYIWDLVHYYYSLCFVRNHAKAKNIIVGMCSSRPGERHDFHPVSMRILR
jgi:hypothetical protein